MYTSVDAGASLRGGGGGGGKPLHKLLVRSCTNCSKCKAIKDASGCLGSIILPSGGSRGFC